MFRLLPLALVLACGSLAPAMEDNSLESASVQGDGADEGTATLEGALAVADAGGGDWTVTVDGTALTVHSPSRADLSSLDGVEGTVTVARDLDLSSVAISDADGVRFVSTVADDGSTWFGAPRWKRGEVLGRGDIVNEYDEPNAVRFTDVVVSGDDGDVVLLPGEPASIAIGGATYRVTVVAAYEAINETGAKCGMSDMLAIELVRTDEDAGDPLVREKGFLPPMGGCG